MQIVLIVLISLVYKAPGNEYIIIIENNKNNYYGV